MTGTAGLVGEPRSASSVIRANWFRQVTRKFALADANRIHRAPRRGWVAQRHRTSAHTPMLMRSGRTIDDIVVFLQTGSIG
jgi:hypothetical protein